MIIANTENLKIDTLDVPEDIKKAYPKINIKIMHIRRKNKDGTWTESCQLECMAKIYASLTYKDPVTEDELFAGVSKCAMGIYNTARSIVGDIKIN